MKEPTTTEPVLETMARTMHQQVTGEEIIEPPECGHCIDRARAILLEVADAVEHNDEVWARIASYPDRSAVAGDGVYEVVRFLREQAAEEGADENGD